MRPGDLNYSALSIANLNAAASGNISSNGTANLTATIPSSNTIVGQNTSTLDPLYPPFVIVNYIICYQ
jgi:hypothetical protein